MDTPNVSGPTGYSPNFGVGRLRNDREGRNRRSFEEAFEKKAQNRRKQSSEPGVESDDSPESDGRGKDDAAKSPILRRLQGRERIIRKDEEGDGLLHIDVVV